MDVRDDGTKLVVVSTPMLIGKILAVVFSAMAVLFPLVLVAALVLPPRTATIDCSRARATCELSYAANHWTVRIADVVGAEVQYRSGRRNESPSDRVVVRARDGRTIELSGASYHERVTAGYRTAVAGIDHFLADPTQPTFATTFVASDTDWLVLVFFALISPLFAWFLLKLWVRRDVEIDRSTRTLRVRRTPRIGASTDRSIPLGEITGLRITGQNWAHIMVDTPEGVFELVTVPRAPGYVSYVRQIVGTLASLTGVRPAAEGSQEGFWGVG